MPHLTDTPDNASGVCILTGTSADPEGFLNLELPTDPKRLGNPAIVSVTYLREIAALVGNAHPVEVEALTAQLATADLRIQELELENKTLSEQNEALIVTVGPKLHGRMMSLKQAAGFKGRRRMDHFKDFMNGEIDEVELEEKLEAAERLEIEAAAPVPA